MMFDGMLFVQGVEILGKDQHGEDHVQMVIQPAIMLPLGPQAAALPVGNFRIPMSKKTALEKAEELRKAAEQLPDERDLGDFVVASSMEGVDKVAAQDQKLKSGK